MRYEGPPDPRAERRQRITGRIAFVASLILIGLVAYLGYVGYEGSRQLTGHPNPSRDCRTPALMGWAYEAVNYDVAVDTELAAEPDPTDCAMRGAGAGEEITGPGGVRLAAWYVPAGSGLPPTGPTVVLVHGWGNSKSNLLDRAAVLHDAYNLLLIDLRNHGQSAAAATTMGVREAGDLRAMLDWLETAKAPDRVAVIGVSMGGATALAAAVRDERIDALVVESTHATIANTVEARLVNAGYPLALPGSWAVLLGTLVRSGVDVSSADPIQAVDDLDGRPLLLVYGTLDDTIGETDADDMLAEAIAADVPAELVRCDTAGHAETPEACPDVYASAMLGFLGRALGSGD